MNIERVRHEGVNIDDITVIDKAQSGSPFVSYRSQFERDFIFNIRNSAFSHLSPEHLDESLLYRCNHFHIMGSSLFSFRMIDSMRKVIQLIKNNNGTVSFDPNVRKEMMNIPEMQQAFDYILEYTDIFFTQRRGNPLFLRPKECR